ncbi:MAG: hypothetical protein LBB09_02940 [Rickettsiales bacterium]|jgi:hypothetical protein|nr:hypothetical protein [Rickettsiales bacterium]
MTADSNYGVLGPEDYDRNDYKKYIKQACIIFNGKGDTCGWRLSLKREMKEPKRNGETTSINDKLFDSCCFALEKIKEEISFFEKKIEETELALKKLDSDESLSLQKKKDIRKSLVEQQISYGENADFFKNMSSELERELFNNNNREHRVNIPNITYMLYRVVKRNAAGDETMDTIVNTGLLNPYLHKKGDFLTSDPFLFTYTLRNFQRGKCGPDFLAGPPTITPFDYSDQIDDVINRLINLVGFITENENKSFIINYPKGKHFTSVTFFRGENGELTAIFADPINNYAKKFSQGLKKAFENKKFGENARLIEVEGIKNNDFNTGNACYLASFLNSTIAKESIEKMRERNEEEIKKIFEVEKNKKKVELDKGEKNSSKEFASIIVDLKKICEKNIQDKKKLSEIIMNVEQSANELRLGTDNSIITEEEFKSSLIFELEFLHKQEENSKKTSPTEENTLADNLKERYKQNTQKGRLLKKRTKRKRTKSIIESHKNIKEMTGAIETFAQKENEINDQKMKNSFQMES